MPPSSPTAAQIDRFGRVVVAGLAILLAGVTWTRLMALHERQREMTSWLSQAGVAVPRELEYEPDVSRTDLRASRAALGAELDPNRVEKVVGDGQLGAANSALLERAAELATGALRERPTAWEAAMTIGGATYLARSRAHDPRLFSDSAAWEKPFAVAIALAPGRPDAARLLAGAYLEIWPYLSPNKREHERELLTSVFKDAGSFTGLVRPWLDVAEDRTEAFAAIPPDPDDWMQLQRIYAEKSDWQAFGEARQRWDRNLLIALSERLKTAERVAGVDPAEARLLFLDIITQARPDRRYLEILTRALESCPSGAVDRQMASHFSRLFDWSTELCRVASCPLPAPALARLGSFCRDLSPRLDAMGALVGGDLNRAEILSRTYATEWSDEWASFRLLKAKMLAAQGPRTGQTEEAADQELLALPRSWRSHPSLWQVREAIAKMAGDTAGEAAAARELEQLAASSWPASTWDVQSGVWKLEFLAGAVSPALTIEVREASALGAAVEIRLDQSILGVAAVRPGMTLRVTGPVTPGPHLLEFEAIAGGVAHPGDVRLTAG